MRTPARPAKAGQSSDFASFRHHPCRRRLITALLALACAAPVAAQGLVGSVIASGLNSPRGLTIGPDGVPIVQVRLTTGETPTLRVVEQAGFASSLPVGSPVTAQFCAGDRSNGVITGSTAPGARPALAGPGDRSMYAYGYSIAILSDGIHITGPLFVAGDLAVTGTITATGEITAKSGSASSVTLSQHHGHAAGTQPPTPGT